MNTELQSSDWGSELIAADMDFLSLEESMGKILSWHPVTRAHITNSGIYVIRDVFDCGGEEFHSYKNGAKLLRCEYATKADGKIVWKPCKEGVSFEDIEPLA